MRPQLFGFAPMPWSTLVQILAASLSLFSKTSASEFYRVRQVGTVPETPNLENLALRHTGEILVTSTQSGTLYQLTPNTANGSFSNAIAEIEKASSLLGITGIERDVFYLFASDYSSRVAAPYTNTLWKVDMHPFQQDTLTGKVHQGPKTSLVANITSAGLLNGMAKLDDCHILGTDSAAGNVVRINFATGVSAITVNDTSMRPLSNGIKVGVNGIHIHDQHLYFTSLDQRLFASVPVSPSGYATGTVSIIANNSGSADDFAISRDGNKAWVAINGAQDGSHRLLEVDIDAGLTSIVSNSSLLQSTSAVALTGDGGLYITGAAEAKNWNTVGAILRAHRPGSCSSRSIDCLEARYG